MTNVDTCELDPSECNKVNVLGTKYLFEAAKSINAHFEFVSTDFVFDGKKAIMRRLMQLRHFLFMVSQKWTENAS